MSYGESSAARTLREENQRNTFPELGMSDPATVLAVDRLRRQEARPPTSVGYAIEGYDPSAPDAMPNADPWTPQPPARGGINQYMPSYDEGYQPASPALELPTPTPGRFDNAVVNAPGQALERMGHVANYLPIGQENQQRLDSAISGLPYHIGDLINAVPQFAVGGEELGAARGLLGAAGSVAAPLAVDASLPENTPDWLRSGARQVASVAGGAAGLGLGGAFDRATHPMTAHAAFDGEVAPATALEGPRDPVTALMESIKSAKPLQDQNKELLSQFRSRQAGGFSGAVGNGESGFGRGLSAMRGTAERVGFEPLRDVIGQQGVDELFTRLGNASLRPFEHASAGSALRNIMDGVVPVPSELAQLEKAYPGLTKALRDAKIVSGPSLGEYAADLASVPQSLKSAFDLSGFRQTATASYGHPIMAGKAFAQSLKAAASEGNFQAIQQDLNDRWYAPMRADAGVAIANSEQGLSRGEGTIISTIVNKIPGYRPSQRAYATMLNVVRDGLFQNMVEGWGGDVKAIPPEELRRWGRMINITTGRGDVSELAMLGHELPVGGITDNKVAGVPLFWAPRLMLSRIQMPFEMLSSSPQVRKEVARQLVAFVGVNATILGMGKAAGMWDVEGDPRSSDFGQIHVGNQRIDPWAGFRPIVNLVSRIKSGEVKSTMAGGTYTKDRLAVAEDFLRQKFSPITSTGANVLTGKDAIGQPVTPGSVGADLVTPLFLKDVYEATKIDGPGAGARALLGGLGLGINTYEPTKGSGGYPTLDSGKAAAYPNLSGTTQGGYPRLGAQ